MITDVRKGSSKTKAVDGLVGVALVVIASTVAEERLEGVAWPGEWRDADRSDMEWWPLLACKQPQEHADVFGGLETARQGWLPGGRR